MDSLVNVGGIDAAIDNGIKDLIASAARRPEDGKFDRRCLDLVGDFIELLLKIVTIDALERLSENDIETISQRSNFAFIEKNVCMILRYQRLLFARLFKGNAKDKYWPLKGEK